MKPKRIYLGCKINEASDDYQELKKLADEKGVELVKMKINDSKYLVTPANE